MLIAAMIEVPDADTDDSWMGLEYIEELYEETEEQRQHALNKIIGEFKGEEGDIVRTRFDDQSRDEDGNEGPVRLAMKGDREARNILIATRTASWHRPLLATRKSPSKRSRRSRRCVRFPRMYSERSRTAGNGLAIMRSSTTSPAILERRSPAFCRS